MHYTQFISFLFLNSAVFTTVSDAARLYERDIFDYEARDPDFDESDLLYERDIFDYEARDADFDELDFLYGRDLLYHEYRDAHAYAEPSDLVKDAAKEVTKALEKDKDKVHVEGHGTFSTSNHHEHKDQNPKTGEHLVVPAKVGVDDSFSSC